jgi:hypothetical protein
VGFTLPADRGVRDLDCAPDDPAAFPGQTQRFARERFGVGGFDFNCNGRDELLAASVEDMTSCSLNGSTCNYYYNPISPECGESLVIGDCFAGCSLHNEQFTQLCR